MFVIERIIFELKSCTWLFTNSSFIILIYLFFISILDLSADEFKAGRNETNDLCISKDHLPDKILSRISKVHFQIQKDTEDLQSPTFIVVSKYLIFGNFKHNFSNGRMSQM